MLSHCHRPPHLELLVQLIYSFIIWGLSIARPLGTRCHVRCCTLGAGLDIFLQKQTFLEGDDTLGRLTWKTPVFRPSGSSQTGRETRSPTREPTRNSISLGVHRYRLHQYHCQPSSWQPQILCNYRAKPVFQKHPGYHLKIEASGNAKVKVALPTQLVT